jgi:eukaryotic-like serine/threonine-protein kinase
MRMKLGLALVGVMGLAVAVGLACAQEAPKDKAAKEKAVPPSMVAVPAGEFIMGMSADDCLNECRKFLGDKCGNGYRFKPEGPVHKVYLDAFYIDKTEVPQADYNRCVAAGKCQANHKYDGVTPPRQPVVGVTWDDARSYCSWTGKRLPTEAEWEKAARGTDGRMYPWGNEFDGKKANYLVEAKTAPVGSYPSGASPYGALDMAGNAREWVADWYQEDYYRQSPERNPKGPDDGEYRVMRGGRWTPYELRVSNRTLQYPPLQYDDLGFRCAGD